MEWKKESCDIGVIGMAVMGKNIALNFADHGEQVAVYNRTTQKTVDAVEAHPEQHLMLTTTLEGFVQALKRPRRILLMIQAGRPVDLTIDALLPLLDAGDLIMDGGNSFYKDTQRRTKKVEAAGFSYLGVGVSGGEEGARRGPAMMPGGSRSAYDTVGAALEKIAAKAEDGIPCCAYMGSDGAGHYVKMVHNGIEYADMQLLAEIVDLFRRNGKDWEHISSILSSWQGTELASYLSEITAVILSEADGASLEKDLLPDEDMIQLDSAVRAAGTVTSDKIIDHILDLTLQKGTGKWTNQDAIDLGLDLSILGAGLNARFMSTEKSLRVQTAETWDLPETEPVQVRKLSTETLADAFLLARLSAYAQGFSLYQAASAAYGWNLDYRTIAQTFRNGCIIRSALLSPIMDAYEKQPDLPHLLLAPTFGPILTRGLPALRAVVSASIQDGVATPALTAALTYLDHLRTPRGTGNIIAAQRDYFGAHQFRRVEGPGLFHHLWPGATEEEYPFDVEKSEQ